jgi:hypothetical protein
MGENVPQKMFSRQNSLVSADESVQIPCMLPRSIDALNDRPPINPRRPSLGSIKSKVQHATTVTPRARSFPSSVSVHDQFSICSQLTDQSNDDEEGTVTDLSHTRTMQRGPQSPHIPQSIVATSSIEIGPGVRALLRGAVEVRAKTNYEDVC